MKKVLLLTLLSSLFVASISAFQYDAKLAQKLGAYSLATYCSTSKLQNWNCGDTCSRIEPLQGIKMQTSGKNIFYMIGYNQKEDAIIIAVRGTVPWSGTNWLTDLSTLKIDYKKCQSCQVHQGFYEAMQTIIVDVQNQFRNLRKQHPQSKIYITGHSLGAAIATLLVPEIYMLNGNKSIDAFYTMGSPRVGNNEFSDWFTANNNFSKLSGRISLNRDPVVQVPYNSFPFLFKHLGNEIFYKDTSSLNNYTQCQNPENKNCSFGIIIAANVSDHMSYFGWNWGIEQLKCQDILASEQI